MWRSWLYFLIADGKGFSKLFRLFAEKLSRNACFFVQKIFAGELAKTKYINERKVLIIQIGAFEYKNIFMQQIAREKSAVEGEEI